MHSINSYISYVPRRLMSALLILLVSTGFTLAAQSVGAANNPVFNKYQNAFYNGVFIGNEDDFLRVGPNGTGSFESSKNTLEACSGKVDLWMYVHNGQETKYNGMDNNGTGVANNTRLKLDLPSGEDNSHQASASVSASNASSVTDTATITCGNQEVELSYVAGSASGFSEQRGNFTVDDSIIGQNGALIGTFADDGVVPGCWEFRVWVKVTVEIKKVEQPKPIFSCDTLDAIVVDRNTRKLKALATARNGAKVVSYDFDFGDGMTESVTTDALEATTAEHDYAPGTYDADVTVNFDTGTGGPSSIRSDACRTEVTVEEEPEAPIYVCNGAVADPRGIKVNQTTTVTVDAVAQNGATIKSLSYTWGDGSDPTVTDKLEASHKYTKVGTYNITVTVTFDVDGEEKTDVCETKVEVGDVLAEQPPAKELPNTGIAGAAAGFFGTGALGISVKSWLESRKLMRNGALRKFEK